MENIKGRDCSTAYGENPGAELPTKDIIRGVRKEASADKKAKNKINNSEAVLRVVDVKRNDEQMPDESEILDIYNNLSKKGQAKLSAYGRNLQGAEKLEKEAHKFEAEFDHNTCAVTEGTSQPARRKQRPQGQNTVRKNYSLAVTMADAIQEASKSKGLTASRYIEEVMGKQSEVIEVLHHK